ncbi:hypothetical protein K2X85_19830 [bacterium]|nr:hypothetical protein [bacterium]
MAKGKGATLRRTKKTNRDDSSPVLEAIPTVEIKEDEDDALDIERVTARLRQTILNKDTEDYEKGYHAGKRWACEIASYDDLSNLYDGATGPSAMIPVKGPWNCADPRLETTYATEFVRVLDGNTSEHNPEWIAVERFWLYAANVNANDISSYFVRGFVEGGVEVFNVVKDHI